jgi:hypothetical protein
MMGSVISAVFGIWFFIVPSLPGTSAQKYCIDRSAYLRWLCNNVRGAEQACWESPLIGNYPDYDSCERARKSTLPNDYRWQSMTKCVSCGTDNSGAESRQKPSREEEKESEANRMIIAEVKQKMEEMVERKKEREEIERKLRADYIKNEIEKEREQAAIMGNQILKDIKISSPPVSSLQKSAYKRSLEHAACVAYTSIVAAELAMQGSFELSNNLVTELEKTRDLSSAGFDDNRKLLCPEEMSLEVPQVYSVVEADPQYIRFNEITKSVQVLMPRIESNYKRLLEVKKIKDDNEKKLKELNEKEKELVVKAESVKSSEEKNTITGLLEKARALRKEAEAERQNAIQEEERLKQEKQKIEKELNELKAIFTAGIR